MVFSTLSIVSSFVAWWAQGQEITLQSTFLSLSLDILILRELTGGVYFGEPKEIVTLENGEKRAVDTQLYTTP